ncbi:MAG: bifunctional adenosylcobinamide kinase/adenosylcobinamide-phosphate guanylyltransferase [Acidobacteriota bacterium]
MSFTFVLGGARSGKSRFAQSLADGLTSVVFLATARADDDEMRSRILRHQKHRPSSWKTVEEPLAIVETLRHYAATCEGLILDCLTLWLSNWCWENRDLKPEELEQSALGELRRMVAGPLPPRLIVISNDVGTGLVPQSPVGRQFRDLQGLVNQEVAARADRVYWMIAGLPVIVKG